VVRVTHSLSGDLGRGSAPTAVLITLAGCLWPREELGGILMGAVFAELGECEHLVTGVTHTSVGVERWTLACELLTLQVIQHTTHVADPVGQRVQIVGELVGGREECPFHVSQCFDVGATRLKALACE
jgi:hypothetical protein